MKNRRTLPPALLVVALVVTLAPSSLANARFETIESPTPWLKKKVEEARQLAERDAHAKASEASSLEGETEVLINEILSWDELTRRALGSEWKKRSKREQATFSRLFRKMIEASYRSKMRLAMKSEVKKPKKVKIEWLDERIKKDGRATVSAKVQADKTTTFLEFALVEKNDEWRVYDLTIDDAGTVRTYRSMFKKMIHEQGFDAILDRMRRKIDDIRAGRGDLADLE